MNTICTCHTAPASCVWCKLSKHDQEQFLNLLIFQELLSKKQQKTTPAKAKR